MQEQKSTAALEMKSLYKAARKMAHMYGQIGLNEPQDIAQAAMVKLLRKDDGRQPSISWLYKVVRSVAFDANRAYAREQRAVWDAPAEERRVCEPVYPYGVRECEIDLMPRLKKMLGQLRQPLRQVLVLYAEGYSYQEIAELTGANIGTVRSRLHYARRRAKDLLGEV